MPPPPLLGYNNNVRHRGRIFHIQTEDSGIASPRIMTHLFADGGRIVKSTRTDYSEHLERDDMAKVVKNMMKEQHKAMFVALRAGELDELIGFEEAEGLEAPTAKSETKIAAAEKRASESPKTETSAAEEADQESSAEELSEDEKAYAASRPASIFSVPPPARGNIFGDVGIDEKSLDDAILSYLAEDPEEEVKE